MKAIKEREKRKVSVVAVDEQELRSHVSEVVRQSVEETLNGLLEAEADALCHARALHQKKLSDEQTRSWGILRDTVLARIWESRRLTSFFLRIND